MYGICNEEGEGRLGHTLSGARFLSFIFFNDARLMV